MLITTHTVKTLARSVMCIFLLLCVVFSYGGGSALIQGLAWVTMIPAQVASSGSIETGLKNTFNGDNACSLCNIAADLREIDDSPKVPNNKEKGKTKAELKEKTIFSLAKVSVTFPSRVLIPLPKDVIHKAHRIDNDVDTPPPQYI